MRGNVIFDRLFRCTGDFIMQSIEIDRGDRSPCIVSNPGTVRRDVRLCVHVHACRLREDLLLYTDGFIPVP